MSRHTEVDVNIVALARVEGEVAAGAENHRRGLGRVHGEHGGRWTSVGGGRGCLCKN